MTEEAPPEAGTLPWIPLAGNFVSVRFTPVGAMQWIGEGNCKHGVTQNATFQIAPGVPPLNHAGMVEATYRQHDQVVGCDCPRQDPKLNATVTFDTASGCDPGQQRYINQLSVTIQPSAKANFRSGPPLTCTKTGAYQVNSKVQLIKGLAQGAAGFGVILLSGQPVISVPMVDEGGKATANIVGIINVAYNQSIAVGYENTSAAVQDVTSTTLTVSEVWVP